MSETELRVVCRSCGAEVSPYVTECPYCGARVRKRAPDLEAGRDGELEPKQSRREKRRREKQRQKQAKQSRQVSNERFGSRPWATLSLILIPAVALLVRIATGNELEGFGGAVVPIESEWWRIITAPFAYLSVGYLFAVGLTLAIFGPGLERKLGTIPTFLLLVACGALGTLAAAAIADLGDGTTIIAGGNGLALGAIAAWYMVTRSANRNTGESIEVAGVAVAAAVILLLPVVVPTADFWSGLIGGAVGLIAGFTAARFSSPR